MKLIKLTDAYGVQWAINPSHIQFVKKASGDSDFEYSVDFIVYLFLRSTKICMLGDMAEFVTLLES